MNSTIFLGYNSYNDDNNFDVTNYYSSSDDYIKALEKYGSAGSEMAKIERHTSDLSFAKCQCLISDENDKDMSIDDFVSLYNKQGMSMLVLNLNLETEDEEFDMELNGWFMEHEQIAKLQLNDYDKFLLEPSRSIKVIFNNKANKETYCTLENVRIVDRITQEKYVVLVDKVIFTKSF